MDEIHIAGSGIWFPDDLITNEDHNITFPVSAEDPDIETDGQELIFSAICDNNALVDDYS